MPRTIEFKVTIELPDDMYVSDMREYIKDALQGWKGQFHPDDPAFSIDRDSVKVVRLIKRKQK